ncbi:bifunctional ADP-dependent NAD(P)H-hydrate dehydratase/NAD(P)H-hydrate epimerase, partial [Cyanobium sp. Lug-B]|nr:bifunctional ADP-dependent NAD(P)H-hydrate dehydratase/NAD(P)H-hydrate epimerase [Cyanobium sp. Lug-B]
APDERRWQLLAACPEAARAGLGDVLAGYAAGRGALALAAIGQGGTPGADAVWLAAAALDHALAGVRSHRRHGAGGVTPLAVAKALENPEPLE